MFFLAVSLGKQLYPTLELAIPVSALAFCLLLCAVVFYRLMTEQSLQQERHYSQMEAYVSLTASIQPSVPLPPMRGWAASPDFACLAVAEISPNTPASIVELGSGVSTLALAYALKNAGKRHVISIDHDPEFACQTRELLKRHGLSQWATVFTAPIFDQTIEGEHYQWYDLNDVKLSPSIDLLVVDGPPGTFCRDARYPAIAVLGNLLSANAVVLLDDANREDEKRIVNRWIEEMPELQCSYPPTEKGAARLRRVKSK